MSLSGLFKGKNSRIYGDCFVSREKHPVAPILRHVLKQFSVPLVRDKADCLSSGRLREVKKQLKIASASCERRSLMRGGHFYERFHL